MLVADEEKIELKVKERLVNWEDFRRTKEVARMQPHASSPLL
jgi:hypothetical protein